MPFKITGDRLCRVIAIAGFVAAVLLVVVTPDRFKEPDDWAYYAAVENISHGQLTVDNALHQQQVFEVRQQGGQLVQYVQIGPNEWAFEKAPGYVYFLAPFYLAGASQLANILLAAGLAFVIYLLLKKLTSEKTACIGILLALFTPVSLAMMQREYMDGFASAAFPGIGGGLYIYYCLKAESLRPKASVALLFLSGFFLAASVAVRYTDAVIVAVFALHFAVTRFNMLRQGKWSRVVKEASLIGAGALIPLALLSWYHFSVFGSPFAYGYEYTKLNVKFAYDYIGDPRAWQIVLDNLRKMPWPLLTGFPLLILAIPAALTVIWQRTGARFWRRHGVGKVWWPVLNPDLFWLLVGWMVAVFGLYLMYEWTANQRIANQPFVILARFYLPALLPMAVLAAWILGRIPDRIASALVVTAIIVGGVLFAQASARELHGGGPGPSAQGPPLGQLSPAELARVIERTRYEVKVTPTNESNYKQRLDVLIRWIGELNSSGFPVGNVVPASDIKRIQDLINGGFIHQACVLIDTAYGELEQVVIAGN